MKQPLSIPRPNLKDIRPMTPLQMNTIQFKGARTRTRASKADKVR